MPRVTRRHVSRREYGRLRWWESGRPIGPRWISPAWEGLGRVKRDEPFAWTSLGVIKIPRRIDDLGRWLLMFAELDLETQSEERWMKILGEALEVASPLPIVEGDIPSHPPQNFMDRMKHVQRWFRNGLVTLAQGGEWAWTERRKHVLRIGEQGTLTSRGQSTALEKGLKRAVFEILTGVGRRFRSCPECRRPFIARKRQGYCTATCSQTRRTREYRARHREQLRDRRHEAYARRVKARLSEKVKVKRIPRRKAE